MRAKKFVCCLLAMLLLAGVSFISCGNSSKAKADSELTTQNGEDFKSFLDKFTSSAAFQYTRIKFPLKTPITLLADDGETEKTFPFTKEKWPLLDSETMKEERITQEEGGIYVSKFTLNEPKHKIFEAGYEESEVDLRVEFELQADEDKERGKREVYELGTVAMIRGNNNSTFLLLAISEYDKDNIAHTSVDDLEMCIKSLLNFYDQHGQGHRLVIPLMGTNLSRAGLSHNDSLRVITSLFQLYGDKIHGEVDVVIYKGDKDKVTLDI